MNQAVKIPKKHESCKLRRVMSCWHRAVVSTVSGELDVPIVDYSVMVDGA